MKKFCLFVVAAIALAFCQIASAADISQPRLQSMGLGGMQPISQHEANQVRGQGIVIVGGSGGFKFGIGPNVVRGQAGISGFTPIPGGFTFAGGGSIAYAR